MWLLLADSPGTNQICVSFNSNPKSERSEGESETSSNTPNLCVICQLLSRGLLLSAIRV